MNSLRMILAAVIGALLLASSPASSQELSRDSEQRNAPDGVRTNADIREKWKEVVNANVVTIISGTPSGSYLRIAYDISDVTSKGNELRVIPMIGEGAVQNIRDIMFLRGVDMGLVNIVALKHFTESGELGADLKSQLAYIMPLFQDELHVLARKEIKSFADLEGKRVNFSRKGSGAQLSSRMIFDALDMNVQEFNMGQAAAINMMKSGELEATLCTCLKPLSAHSRVNFDDGLHLLPVKYDDVFKELYQPAFITHEDYPNLIPEGQKIETIAVQTLLASYNWPKNHSRYSRVKKFVNSLFENFEKLKNTPHHPRWKTVNLNDEIKGWKRLPAAQDWLDRYATRLIASSKTENKNDRSRSAFNSPLTSSRTNKFSALDKKKRDALYAEFVQWMKEKDISRQ